MDDAESSSGRSKRQRIDKTGRLSALEKLKQLKGSKHKYEVTEVDNVYDEVDEKIYSKTVMQRQNDDWIVDDGGNGYVEDGREIFDDDLDADSIQEAAKNNSLAGPRKKKKVETKNKGSIKNMLMNMSSKKKADDKLEDDDILGDLMTELQKEQPTPKRKETKVANKFAIQKSQPAANQEVSQKLDVDDFLGPMFESKPTKSVKETKGQREKNSREVSKFVEQSTSQQIENVETQSQDENEPIEIENCASQENQMEVVNYDEELANIDFEDGEFDQMKKSKCDEPEKKVENKTEPIKKTQVVENPKNENLTEAKDDIFDLVEMNDFAEQLTEAEFMTKSDEIKIDSIPLVTNKSDEKVFRFFWWDAYEDPYKQPGVVYLFGKTFNESSKSYVSCCLQVKNIPRRLYLLPREYINNEEDRETTMADVYEEFNKWATKNRVTEFRSAKVSKLYAFDRPNTPKESEYLEVRYPSNFPVMDENYSGPAIEHVFGRSVNAMELFLTERSIKGPCWLDVKNPLPAGNAISWCKLQVNCTKMENISVHTDSTQKLPVSPLVMATLNIRMSLNSKLQQNEVVMISILLHNEYQIDKPPPKPLFQQHYCLITHPKDTPWPRHARNYLTKIRNTKIVIYETEYDLLEGFLDIVETTDPDLLIGYDCGYQFDVLMHRISALKVKNWSRVSKLRRSAMPMFKGKVMLGQCFGGRPVCDIQVSAKELNLKVRSYDLQALCCAVLKKDENSVKEIKPRDCIKFYSEVDKIEKLIQITMNETLFILTLLFELNVMPLAVQITCIAGNVLSRTLAAGRAERNEFLLLHAFYEKGYITPDRQVSGKNKKDGEATARRKKPAYAGGLVLEPKKGFYDKLILLMDFNSLYPSIIQEYNLCFTTVPGAAYSDLEDLTLPEDGLEPGVIPTEIRKLVESRGEVKKLMKTPNLTPELRLQYNIRQLALKLTANSMYGCLGATHCRFYAKGLAALVTSKGREILQNTKSLVEKLNFEVIYGDTDSIMINTGILNYDEAFTIAKKIKQEVNRLYRKVELDTDGVFRYLLLLQKKKYAAVLMSKSQSGKIELAMEHKGLDIVRRDWSQIACDTGKNILDQLLSDQSDEERRDAIFEILNRVATSIRSGQVPLSSLVITKQLSRNPQDYPDKKMPHVAVALRLNKKGGRMWKAGDTVPYVICEDGTTNSANLRAYHIDELKKSETLKIDVNYYILSQVFPIVLRLCEPIEGIDDVLLARHLGMEDIYRSKRVVHEEEEEQVPLQMNEDRFKYCTPLKFKCRNEKCQMEIEIKEFFTTFNAGRLPSLSLCPNSSCDLPPWKYVKSIQNALQLAIRKVIMAYYSGWMECGNPVCTFKTRRLLISTRGDYPACEACKDSRMYRIYSETKLYNQLSFYLHLFDFNQHGKHLQGATPPELISAYELLKEFVEKHLSRNAYSVVDLDQLFTTHTSTLIERIHPDQTEGSDYEFSDEEMIPDDQTAEN